MRLTRRSFLAGTAGAALILPWPAAGADPADPGPPPLAGEFAEYFNLRDTPLPALPVPFTAAGGRQVTIEDFRGRVVVLNFWATWCAPCVVEMPALDRLQQALGAEGVSVVAVSEDRGGETAVIPFYHRTGITALELYTDPQGYLAEAFGVRGLPTTFLIDSFGRIVGGLEGSADWASPEARDLVRHYLPRKNLGGQAT